MRALLLALLLALSAGVFPAAAQTAAPPPSAFVPRPAAAPPSGIIGQITVWQARAQGELTAALRNMKREHSFGAALALVLVSFVYGVIHAAGPGHGKAVLTSYALADAATWRRGAAVSLAAAVVQALSALIVVGVMVGVLNATGSSIQSAEGWLERVSFAAVALFGGAMFLRTLLRPAGQAKHEQTHGEVVPDTPATVSLPARGLVHSRPHAHAHAHAHQHEDPHAHGFLETQPKSAASTRSLAEARVHTHTHSENCGCGHAHAPEPAAMQGAWSLRRAAAMALAVGIRPCTGAILVLVFAIAQGMAWAGVVSTFAMALGTALTVAALAASAVAARGAALRFGWGGSGAMRAAALTGYALMATLGTLLFLAALGPQRPF